MLMFRTLTLNPTKLIKQVFMRVPPISAFIDYLIVLIRKNYTNSVNSFYRVLF